MDLSKYEKIDTKKRMIEIKREHAKKQAYVVQSDLMNELLDKYGSYYRASLALGISRMQLRRWAIEKTEIHFSTLLYIRNHLNSVS